MNAPNDAPHSAIYFGDARDHWWNPAQIDHVARQLGLDRRRRVLDVGCGYGHWARLWLPRLARGVDLVGIDPETRSIGEAAARTAAFLAERRIDANVTWEVATAEALPFDDGAFDVVTAQTVLIHVRDVGVALDEMVRVLAPGGVLLLAEPNNLVGSLTACAEGPEVDVPRALRAFELELRIEKGKHALGEGFLSIGEALPRHLDARRFTQVDHWLCDRPYGLHPPYDTPGAREEIDDLRHFFAQGWHGRPREDALRMFLAGGGTHETFDVAWNEGLDDDRRRLEAIDAGRHASAGGHVFHLFGAKKR